MKTRFTLLISLFAITFLNAQIDLEAGLIAHYEFIETENVNDEIPDASLNGNDLKTYNLGDFDTDRHGGSDGAVLLKAYLDRYMTLNEQLTLSDFDQLDQYSFAFYNLIVPSQYSTDGYYPLLSIEEESGNNLQFFMRKIASDITYGIKYDNGTEVFFEDEFPYYFPEYITWAHISFSFDALNDKVKFYINGEIKKEFNVPLSSCDNAKIYFGKSSIKDARGTCYDDMFVYNRILNPEEVDALNDIIPTAVIDLEPNENISIYPIPSTDKNINIKVQTYTGIFDIRFYDQLGRMVKASTISSNTQLDLSALGQGTYYLNLYLEDGVYTKKIVLLD